MKENMLYCLPPGKHGDSDIQNAIKSNPQIRFVSLASVDSFGNHTDEKIPIGLMLEDIEKFLRKGVQTDGSSVLLPRIAVIENARVDLLPDKDVNWYVDYNFDNIDDETGLPTGTLRIPAFLVHNDTNEVGSRSILRDAERYFKLSLGLTIEKYPYLLDYLPIESVYDISEIFVTTATEMEFYVKTPHEVADKERLHTSQEMKEQYWKRTIGPVRSALENTIKALNKYGFEVEMGHKEVGGVKAVLGSGGYDHIMEQLEIDWKYSSPMQTADNDRFARYIIKDTFRRSGLDVTFEAKPVDGVAGSGKHVHFGVAARLKDGRIVNLFTSTEPDKHYLSPIGFGSVMGVLRNYEIINPLANCTNDALARLKPGFEAPVGIVTSLGRSVEVPSRNRTVLLGLIRDMNNPLATRFELRSPNPRSNCYMVIAAGLMAMMDGIKAVAASGRGPVDLARSISKRYGENDFYLEKDRVYRAENNIFDDFSEEERTKYFGKAPATVWENVSAFSRCPDKAKVLFEGDVMNEADLNSFIAAAVSQWSTELHDRVLGEERSHVKEFVRLEGGNSLDEARWKQIEGAKNELFKDGAEGKCLATVLSEALECELYEESSELQVIIEEKYLDLCEKYKEYKRNFI